MSATTAAVVQEVASDYAAYATVNMDTELKGIYEAVEEMQLRLEEFTSIVRMLQAQGDKSTTGNVPRFLALRPQVNNLCKRIDALDFFITRVNLDLATLEANMDVAESSAGSLENKFTMLNPFSFLRNHLKQPLLPKQQLINLQTFLKWKTILKVIRKNH